MLTQVLERKLKSQLKDALDEQVQQRQAQDNADMQEEKGRDRFLLECLQKEVLEPVPTLLLPCCKIEPCSWACYCCAPRATLLTYECLSYNHDCCLSYGPY